jgi:hypothetical protein
VTGKSNDGGIDSKGIIKINGYLVSMSFFSAKDIKTL